jgi:gluconokinase
MVVVLMGVAGSGKSTIGRILAHRMGWVFYEGDDFHPEQNRIKMSAGQPLTDEDRAPWLDALAALIKDCLQQHENAIIACSALKQAYRERLGIGTGGVRLVYLRGSPELIAQRLAARHGHFFDPALLQSQLDTLQEPADAIIEDIGDTPDQMAERISAKLAPALPRP